MPWTETGTTLSTTKTVVVNTQDALQISGYQPFVSLIDANAASAQARIQNADGKLVFYPQSSLSAGLPSVIFNSITAPAGKPLPTAIEIHAQDGVTVVGYQPFITLMDANAGYAIARMQCADGKFVFYPQGPFVAASPSVVFDSNGDVFMSGTLSVAKDVVLTGADCAENFTLVEDAICEPGTVMTIASDGALQACTRAYDKKVAGIISGAGGYRPAIVLDKQASDERRSPIAMFGKAYCKADAQNAPIEIGDLLTTSDTAGHAMKASDPAKAFGAVIGKALGNLAKGQGLIPVLITLQ